MIDVYIPRFVKASWIATSSVTVLSLTTAPAQSTYEPYTFITLAGSAGQIGSADGINSAARFNWPMWVAVDRTGNLYVADWGNHTIRQLASSGAVTTLAGLAGTPGIADGTGSAARFNGPMGLAVDDPGNLFLADWGNHTIRQITPSGVVRTLAGLAGSSGSEDGTSSSARFNHPAGVAVDNAGNLFVADSANYTIRKVTPAGVVTTMAGLAGSGGKADGTGSAARFRKPYGIAVDNEGNVYVADKDSYTIRRVTPAGIVTTLAGSTFGNADGIGTAASFLGPTGLALDRVCHKSGFRRVL